MANILEKIVKDKHIELVQRKQAFPLSEFKHEVAPSKKSFFDALNQVGPRFILECKKASPSKGLIRPDFSVESVCGVYKDYADCVSVLTDEKYFQGSFDYLKKARQLLSQPIICKDFFVDEYQVYLARYYGADAILLMLSVLDDNEYQALAELAEQLSLDVLTEVSNEQEVHRALSLNARIIGINNRNLRDLSTNLNTSFELAELIPADKLIVSESGIYTHRHVRQLAKIADAFLVGSSLMAQDNLDMACRKLINGENKICGLTQAEDTASAYQAGAVYGGLIFYSKSPRYVTPQQAKQVMAGAPLDFVGVFVNESPQKVAQIANELQLAAVQLHGNEDQNYIAQLSELLHSSMIFKATAVKDKAPELSLNVDRYVLDTFNAKGDVNGGTGHTFNWSLLDTLDIEAPFILAGGINIENVNEALTIGALGLDINSGVEDSPGQKNSSKIKHILETITHH